jgi:hypothetical protein
MFTRLAKFRRLGPRHRLPPWLEAARSDDKPWGRRRPTGQPRCPQPVLACHWNFVDDGRLECRWTADCLDENSNEEPGGRQPRRSHASSFSAKAICHPRTSFGSRYAPLLYRNTRCDLSRDEMTANEPGAVEQRLSSVARLLSTAAG